MKKGLLSLLLLISIAGFSQSTTTIPALPQKNNAALNDTIPVQNGHTYRYTIQQLYDLIAGNFLTTSDLTSYEQSSHATATYLRKVDTSFLHDQIAQLVAAKLNSSDTSVIHAQIVQVVNAIGTKFNISDTSILHAQIAQAVAAIAANTTAIAGKQATLVSGTTIKTINGASILGSGDIVITGGTGGSTTDASLLTSGTLADARLSGNIAINLTPTAIKTASYTAAANDFVKTDATSGTVPITLPTTPADKARVAVKMIAVSGSNTTTIAAGGSAVFNKAGGSTSISLSLLNQGLIFQYEAATGIWSVTSGDIPLSGLDARYATVAQQSTLKQTVSKLRIPTRFIGTVIPVFQTAAGFENLGAALGTQFSIASGGGLISSTAGTTASGYLQLPRAINTMYTTRTDWLVSWNLSESGAAMTFALDSGTSRYSVTLANVGSNFQATFYKFDGTQINSSDNIGTGVVNVCVSMVTGNGGYTCSVHIINNLSVSNGNKWFGGVNMQWQRFSGARISMAYFATNTATSKIVGFLHNAQGLDGDPNGVLLTRTAAMNLGCNPNDGSNSVPVDNETLMIIPERADLTTPLKTVVYFHGASGYLPRIIIDTAGAGDYGATARALLQAGYAFIGQQGGFGSSTQFSDWWGNAAGLERMRLFYDAYTYNVSNSGKLYLFGMSMGGVCALNFHRQYQGLTAAMELITPVTNLEDSAATYGVQINSTLKQSSTAAYQRWYVSQIASNLNNDPATDDGTKWQVLAEAGALPDIGARSYQITTTSAAATNTNFITATSATNIPVGSYVYFRAARQLRRVIMRSSGSNVLNLDAPMSVVSGDIVCLIYRQPNGEPDPAATDFVWQNVLAGNSNGGLWASSTTYGIGAMVLKNSAHPELDMKPWNPYRFPETFNIPIEIVAAGDGTSTGNDGILANKMMYDFRTAVNAIYANKVTIRPAVTGNGTGHIGAAMNASATLAYFNQF